MEQNLFGARPELHALIVSVRTEVNAEIKGARDEIKSEFAHRLGATESRLLEAIDRLAA